MEFNTILLFIIACIITIYFSWNYTSNRNSSINSRHANDIRYYELRSKYEFLVAVTAFVTATAAFLGYNTFTSVKAEITKNTTDKIDSAERIFKQKVDDLSIKLSTTKDSLSAIKTSVDASTKDLSTYKKNFDQYRIDQTTLNQNSKQWHKSFDEFNTKLVALQNKGILKVPLFVTNFSFKGSDDLIYVEFKDLKTTKGEKLPLFKRPPLILLSPSELSSFTLSRTTTTGFRFTMTPEGMTLEKEKNTFFKVAFLILEVPEE